MSFKPNPKLNNILKNAFTKSLKDSGNILEDAVKSNAPVDTGTLKNSIEIDEGDIKNLEIRVGTDVPYAAAVEFGTYKQTANPFMRKSLAGKKSKIMSQFKDII